MWPQTQTGEDIGTIKSFFEENLKLARTVSAAGLQGCRMQGLPAQVDYSRNFGCQFQTRVKLSLPPPQTKRHQDAPFEFYDPKSPIYTSPRFLPPAKIQNCEVGAKSSGRGEGSKKAHGRRSRGWNPAHRLRCIALAHGAGLPCPNHRI